MEAQLEASDLSSKPWQPEVMVSVTGEPPSVVVEETAQEADIEVIPEIIEPLSILDVLRISAVLEDTTDQLSILNYIMPVQYERRQSSTMKKNNEMNLEEKSPENPPAVPKMSKEEPKLPEIRQGGQLANEYNKVQDLVLQTPARQSVISTETLKKIQNDRQFLSDVIADTMQELQNSGTFNNLLTCLNEERENKTHFYDIIDREEKGRKRIKSLQKELHNVKRERQVEVQLSHTDLELPQRREQLVERTRREAQLAALQYEEEKIRTKQIQRDAVLDFVKQKTSHSPQKQQHPLDGECPFPSRRSQHTDDSALLVNDDRPNAVSSPPTTETVHHSPAYSFPAATQRNQPQRPESFLFRAGVRAETNQGHGSTLLSSSEPTTDSTDPITRQNTRQREEELESIDQLRKHIEYRLKVSLPCDLGAALTDGVVLCHLANHVWPRSVPSIHVPSPAVPKLSIAKCRRNVENFLEACRKIGVPQEQLCLPLHILEEKGLSQVAVTVQALLALAPPKQQQHQLSAV